MTPNFGSHCWQMIGFHKLDGMSNGILPEKCSKSCVAPFYCLVYGDLPQWIMIILNTYRVIPYNNFLSGCPHQIKNFSIWVCTPFLGYRMEASPGTQTQPSIEKSWHCLSWMIINLINQPSFIIYICICLMAKTLHKLYNVGKRVINHLPNKSPSLYVVHVCHSQSWLVYDIVLHTWLI